MFNTSQRELEKIYDLIKQQKDGIAKIPLCKEWKTWGEIETR